MLLFWFYAYLKNIKIKEIPEHKKLSIKKDILTYREFD